MSDSANNSAANFFSLRRIFTRRGVRLLWYAVLFLWLVEFSDQWLAAASEIGGAGVDFPGWGSLIFGTLAALIYLFVARLLFEIAVAVLFERQPAN
jgi:hypothetical protein